MTTESYEFTARTLLNLGFGEEIAGPLQTKMEQNLAEFTLDHVRKFGKDEMHSVIYLSKGDKKDYVFVNRYDATLKQEGKEDLTQTFFIGATHNYTLQERYNMMDGRAVYKEQPFLEKVKDESAAEKWKPTGETYFAWRALDFKAADSFGNFLPKNMFWNHEKEIEKYPIKGIEENYDKQRLIRRLEKGNKVDVILLKEGKEIPAKMVANPRMMRLDFFDSDGQRMSVRKVTKEEIAQSQKNEMSPQEVQKAAIARAAEQRPGEAHTQKEGAKEQVAGEQKNAQRRKQGVHI